jgi:signal transduction histidine kinase/DNA-binding response OmpR family regulator
MLSLLVFLGQPYALLRVTEHFRAVPRAQHVIALGGLVASWVALLTDAPPLSLPSTLILIASYAYVEGYAALALMRARARVRGVARRRLTLVGIASALLAAIMFLAGVGAVTPAPDAAIGPLSQVLALGCAGGYFLAFLPPAWLRRSWQLEEFRGYVAGLAGRSAEERLEAAVDGLGPAAARAVGGLGGVALVWDPLAQVLRVHTDPVSGAALAAAEVREMRPGPENPVISGAWAAQLPLSAGARRAWGEPLRRMADALGGAEGALIAPLRADGEPYGLLVVFLRRGPFFVDDDLAVLALLAAEAGLSLAQTRLVEQLRQRNAALAEASRLKSAFLANMSHELRTPLNAIIGFSELLLDAPGGNGNGVGDDAATSRRYVETIHSSGQHLLALINDVLDLSKIEAGRMELHPEPFELGHVVEQVRATVEPLAAQKGITVSTDLGGAGGVFADEGKVKQVLYNLLSNAIKFTPAGGRVVVTARRGVQTVQLTVSDTGIGIAPADQARLFREFEQLDSGPGRRFEGTGLGLALSRRLVELHGGRLWVESAPGEGSQFHFTVPIHVAASVAPTAAAGANGDLTLGDALPRGAPLVLVVEDDPNAVSILTLHLARGGFRTMVATTADEALRVARTEHPAAVTLDILLPDVRDGWHVLTALKEDPATQHVPVVVVSVVDDERRANALGAVDYFVKPVDRDALLSSLRRILASRDGAGRLEGRILVADDEPAAVDLLAAILRPAGYEVVTAGGGAEAIACARRDAPDALVLDLMMPEVSGFDVIATLRADSALRHLPIVIVTAKELTDEDRERLSGEVVTILQKGTLAGVDLLAWLDDLMGSPVRAG